MKEENMSLLVFIIFGIIVGGISKFFNVGIAFLISVIVMIIIGKVLAKKFNKDTKWWVTNGGLIYIFIWLITWVFFFNLV